jgi:hypothetical protein
MGSSAPNVVNRLGSLRGSLRGLPQPLGVCRLPAQEGFSLYGSHYGWRNRTKGNLDLLTHAVWRR